MFKEFLIQNMACGDAVEWVGERSIEEAWSTCNRADWMLWLCNVLRLDRRAVLSIISDCLENYAFIIPDGKPMEMITDINKWSNRKLSLQEIVKHKEDAWNLVKEVSCIEDPGILFIFYRIIAGCVESITNNLDVGWIYYTCDYTYAAMNILDRDNDLHKKVRERIPLKTVLYYYEQVNK